MKPFAIAFLLALGLPATASPLQRLHSSPVTQHTGTSEKATYAWLRSNVFSACNYCHVSIAGVSFMRHEDVLRHVVPGQPEASRLYYMVVTRRMPPGRGGLPAEEITALRDWISNGAKND
jgi:hypothetical protein